MVKTPTVDLVSCTPDALELLIYTKSTRLQGKQTLEDIKSWSMGKKLEHLAYMRDTIKSSWEFVDYMFEIHGVSRAFTHQFVRTRDQAGIDDPAFGEPDANPAVAAFAQESMRTVNVAENGFVRPTGIKPENVEMFDVMMEGEFKMYSGLIAASEPPQNARGVLGMSVATSIIVKLSLRALHHMAEVRLCTRTQGEYQYVFRMMRDRVIEVHPWAVDFINVFCVNHGTCCFPRYTKCPIQGPLFNPETGGRFDEVPVRSCPPLSSREVLEMWKNIRHEATPVV
jgi:thymidylate synthase ThyX